MEKNAIWREYVQKPRVNARVNFALSAILAVVPIAWLTGLLHWRDPFWVAPLMSGVLSINNAVRGLSYHVEAKAAETIWNRMVDDASRIANYASQPSQDGSET